MTIYQLECFIAVAEELNFSAAAERLFTTQPAITYQINALEKETGLHLFERTTRRTKLTAAGLGAAHALVGENLGTPAEAIRFGLARELAEDGYRLIATGEMGIGNTTTSSAVAAVISAPLRSGASTTRAARDKPERIRLRTGK